MTLEKKSKKEQFAKLLKVGLLFAFLLNFFTPLFPLYFFSFFLSFFLFRMPKPDQSAKA